MERSQELVVSALRALVLQVDAAKWPSPYNPALVDALGQARFALGQFESMTRED